jgi:aminopeptidase N
VGGSQGGVQRIYQKGSLVLDMLRDVMGENDFRVAVKHYLEKYGFKYAETNDFIRCVYEATGKPYNWFFDEWILRGGEPEYKVTWTVRDDTLKNRSTRIQVWQTQPVNELTGLFRMPINFEVHYTDGHHDSIRAWIDCQYNEVLIPNAGKKTIAYVLFDPGRKILKKVTFCRTFEELAAQFAGATDILDRYDALLALRDTPLDKKKDLLAGAFHKEIFHLIRSEILSQLSSDRTPEITEIFREALSDKDANVRKSALNNLDVIPDLLRSTVEKMLTDSSYLNVELALAALCNSFPESTGYYLGLTKNDEGWRGKNIRIKWLEIALGNSNDEQEKKEFMKEIIAYSGPKYEFETRMNALNLLKKLRYIDEETLANARSAAIHWNNKLSAVGKEYLKELTD